MTTPFERFRALVYGAELLARLQSEGAIPISLRSEAVRLELLYPNHDQLVELLKQPGARLSKSMAVAIFDVGKLFEACGAIRCTADDTQQLWRATMRHYPSSADGWHRPESLEAINAADLLEWNHEG